MSVHLINKFESKKDAYFHLLGCEYDHWIGDGYCDDVNNNMNSAIYF